jgi:hypothetical protein
MKEHCFNIDNSLERSIVGDDFGELRLSLRDLLSFEAVSASFTY